MNTLTTQEARDQAMSVFMIAWTEIGSVSEEIPVFWDDVDKDPPASGPYVRVLMRHLSGGEASLSGGTGTQKFTRNGIISVEINTPFGDGLDLNDALSERVLGIFEGSNSTNLWFRRSRLLESGNVGPWFRSFVFTDFEYDQIR